MKAASARDPFADYGGWLSIRQLARPTLLLALGVPVIYASTATHYPQIRSHDGTCKSPLEHVPDPADFDVQFQEGIDMPEDGENTKVDAKPDFQTAVCELKDIARRQLRGAEIMYEIRDKNRERIEKARRQFSALGGDASAHHRELLGQLLANEEEKAVTSLHFAQTRELPTAKMLCPGSKLGIRVVELTAGRAQALMRAVPELHGVAKSNLQRLRDLVPDSEVE